MPTLHDAAVSYARDYGMAIHPLRMRDKRPATENGLKDATTDVDQIDQAWRAMPNLNIGMATGKPSGGIIVIDVDVDDEKGYDGLEYLRKWERERGELPETVMAITGRGGTHLFYRANREIRNTANEEHHIDVRGDGGYVMVAPSIHPNGREVQWENDPEDYAFADADENVYAFIESLKPRHERRGEGGEHERFTLPEKIGEGGRNATLYKYACSLQSKGRTDEEIRDAVHGANLTRCKPPIPVDEVDRTVDSALGYDKGESRDKEPDEQPDTQLRTKNGGIRHNVFGRLLIEKDHACFVDGAPAIWDGKRYATGWDAIDRAIVRHDDACKRNDQKEIRHYIHLKAPRVDSTDATMIAFRNGVLDMVGGLMEYRTDMVITNIIPHNYSADAYDLATDRFLDRISNHDAVVRANLEEVIGLCMYRSNEIGQCPVLLGSGSNGKSTFISALRNVLGKENVSSLDLNVIGKPFQTGRLLGKLANLGDDISNEFLKGDLIATFKKIVTGEWVYTDVKNAEGFEFKPYCTLVFSANEMPSLGDSSEGMMRRLFPIPFDATFRRTDPDYNPRIWEDITSDDAAEYLCRLGVEGLQRVIFQHGMTPNSRSEGMVSEVRTDNNNVLQWIEDTDKERASFIGRSNSEAYAEYSEWCQASGVKPYGKPKFSRKLNEQYGLVTKTARLEFAGTQRVTRVFADKPML